MSANDIDPDPETARRAAMSPLLSPADFRPLSRTVRVEIGAASHRGRMAAQNDDNYLVVRLSRQQETLATSLGAGDLPPDFEEHGYGMLVADGMGEEGAGSLASRVALSTFAHLALHYGKWNLRVDPRTAAEILERAEAFYTRVDGLVSARRRADPALTSMATALTTVLTVGDDLFVAHVGHSRAYVFRDGALIRLTRDQTVASFIPGTVRPTAVEGRTQDLSHILTDAIGAGRGAPEVEVEQFRLVDGDAVLLCTNGLTDAVEESQIADLLAARRRPADQCAALIDLANEQLGADNVTVVLAQYQVPAS